MKHKCVVFTMDSFGKELVVGFAWFSEELKNVGVQFGLNGSNKVIEVIAIEDQVHNWVKTGILPNTHEILSSNSLKFWEKLIQIMKNSLVKATLITQQ